MFLKYLRLPDEIFLP